MLTVEKIKEYYGKGLWTKQMVRMAVIKGKITADDYQSITDETYI